MSKNKELDKKYEYLDEDKDKYFDGITPHISNNRDEEGYFVDKNYQFNNEIIDKYINGDAYKKKQKNIINLKDFLK